MTGYDFMKRGMDILISLFLILILSPLFLMLALLVKADSRGPVIFAHKRLGRYGKPFFLYKFRSMYWTVGSAEDCLSVDQLRRYQEHFKLPGDPRITRVGRFLRRSCLDELPQLWNVLKGELSLIGPRPVVAAEALRYGGKRGEFLSIRPGLTGFWQVCPDSVSYERRMEMELFYIQNRTLRMDCKIMLMTVPAVLRKLAHR